MPQDGPQPDFTDRGAIVTGAATGIGLQIATRLAAAGASVMLNDLDQDAAHAAAESIQKQGGNCIAMHGDASDVAFIRQLTQAAADSFGRVDLTVANAGLTLYGDFFTYDPDRFDRVLALNLRGSFFLAQAAANHMRKLNTPGSILLMSSVAGIQSIPYLSAYGMTKAALQMMARALVSELSPHNIRINAIAPGATLTPRNLEDDPDYQAHWANVTPLSRPATVDDIADAALFFLSPSASHITGQSLTIDGGWTTTSPTPTLDFVQNNTQPQTQA